jgi:hypothetical protein
MFRKKIICLILFLLIAPRSNSLVMMDASSKPEHRDALLQDLRKTTGLPLELQGEFVRVQNTPVLGFGSFQNLTETKWSPTARYLLFGALNSETVYRVRSTRDTAIGKVGGSIDLNFADLNHVTFRNVPKEAFGAGMIFLHELAHTHRGLVDPDFDEAKLDPDVKGATVEFINRIQKELGLPERLHYFPKKLPGRNDVLCIYFGITQRVEIDAKLF